MRLAKGTVVGQGHIEEPGGGVGMTGMFEFAYRAFRRVPLSVKCRPSITTQAQLTAIMNRPITDYWTHQVCIIGQTNSMVTFRASRIALDNLEQSFSWGSN